MSNYETQLKIFLEGRMQPWHPENAVFIAGELAKLFVTDSTQAEALKNHYSQKGEQYLLAHPVKKKTIEPELKEELVGQETTDEVSAEEVVEAPVEDVVEEIREATPVKPPKKKRGRKKKFA